MIENTIYIKKEHARTFGQITPSGKKLVIPIVLFQSIMDVFLMAGVHQQPEQSNYLAEGQT